MAWNKYYIFVKLPEPGELSEILANLGLGHYKPDEEVPLHLSNKPETLFAGFYGDSLLIVHPELPFQFFSDGQSGTEKRFISTFPNSEIAALLENSTSGHFGFTIIISGQKLRMKDGADGEIFHDEGEPLPEEVASFQAVLREMSEELSKEGLSETEIEQELSFEAAWRVPNLLSKRYLGEYMDAIDPEKVILTRYES